MPRIPQLTSLYLQEYVALSFSFVFLILESFLRIITLALPAPVISFFYSKSRKLFNSFSARRYTTVSASRKEKSIVAKVREADGFVDLCELWNEDGKFRIEEHVVQTGDGYLLGLHRVVKRSRRDRSRSRTRHDGLPRDEARGNGGRKVAYLHHGLLMNSEVWVCSLDKERCLPFVLAEKGYDVWLGNNRGNKYSKKSIHHKSNTVKFWDFSIDDFAFHDIPDSINYILETTRQRSLSYIGFSQGTAQAFATLSIHPALNEKVDVFIALAPAMSPAGLHNAVVDGLMKASPNLMFMFFGRKSILSSTTFWQSILYPPIFVRIIDFFLGLLFNWTGNNISLAQKIAAYSHLYSFTSVKSVVHWFQIIRNKCFQLYDDDVQTSLASTISGRTFYKVAKFPTRNISTPIVLVYGGSDSLVDIDVMLKELPSHTTYIGIEHYEHLDFLWGREVEKLVFPKVFDALNKYALAPPPPATPKPAFPAPEEPRVTQTPPAATPKPNREEPPTYSEDESTHNEHSNSGRSEHSVQSEQPPSPDTQSQPQRTSRPSPPRPSFARSLFSSPPAGDRDHPRSASPLRTVVSDDFLKTQSLPPTPPITSEAPSPAPSSKRERSGSNGSVASFRETNVPIGPGGIKLGSGRPVSGVSIGGSASAANNRLIDGSVKSGSNKNTAGSVNGATNKTGTNAEGTKRARGNRGGRGRARGEGKAAAARSWYYRGSPVAYAQQFPHRGSPTIMSPQPAQSPLPSLPPQPPPQHHHQPQHPMHVQQQFLMPAAGAYYG